MSGQDVISSDSLLNGCNLERLPQEIMSFILQYLRGREVFDSVLGLNRWFRVVAEMNTRSLCFDGENRMSNTMQHLQSILPRFDFKHGRGCLQKIVIRKDALTLNEFQSITAIIPGRITVSPSIRNHVCRIAELLIMSLHCCHMLYAITVIGHSFDATPNVFAIMGVLAVPPCDELSHSIQYINVGIVCVIAKCEHQ